MKQQQKKKTKLSIPRADAESQGIRRVFVFLRLAHERSAWVASRATVSYLAVVGHDISQSLSLRSLLLYSRLGRHIHTYIVLDLLRNLNQEISTNKQ